MSELWYYAEGREKRGPIPIGDLLQILSQLSDWRQVLVWRSGFDGWKPAASVSELSERLASPSSPPPLPAAEPAADPAPIREPAVSAADVAALPKVKPELSGIGGWLVLVAIGQVLGPLKMIVSMVQQYSNPDTALVWGSFPVVMGVDAALNAGLLLFVIYTSVLFFRHSKKFPRFFIYQWIAIIFVPVIGSVLLGLSLLLNLGGNFFDYVKLDPKEAGQTGVAIVAAIIWISYILKSRRVANTFTE